jgi:hypothetical protein
VAELTVAAELIVPRFVIVVFAAAVAVAVVLYYLVIILLVMMLIRMLFAVLCRTMRMRHYCYYYH